MLRDFGYEAKGQAVAALHVVDQYVYRATPSPGAVHSYATTDSDN